MSCFTDRPTRLKRHTLGVQRWKIIKCLHTQPTFETSQYSSAHFTGDVSELIDSLY